MKNSIPILFVASSLALSSITLAAASAEDLIKAHVKAIGGVEAHKKHTTRVLRGTLELPDQNMTAQILIQAKAPNKQRTELELPGLGKMVEGFDGKVAWSDNPFTGATEKPAHEQAQARRQADFYRDIELLSRFGTWTVKGRETVRGRPAHVLEGRTEAGDTETIYLDEETLLIVQATTRYADVRTTVQVEDYREVDGVKIPFTIKVDAGPAGSFSLRVKEVRHGVELDDKLFRMPAR